MRALQLGTREEALAGAAVSLWRIGDLPAPAAASPPPPLRQTSPPPPSQVAQPRPPPPAHTTRRSPPPPAHTIRRSPPPPQAVQRSPPPPAGAVPPKLTGVQALGPKTVQATASGTAAAFQLWRFTARPVLGGQNVSVAVAVPQALLAGLKPATKVRCLVLNFQACCPAPNCVAASRSLTSIRHARSCHHQNSKAFSSLLHGCSMRFCLHQRHSVAVGWLQPNLSQPALPRTGEQRQSLQCALLPVAGSMP